MSAERLKELRVEIDLLDERLLELCNQRARLAQQVAEVKQAGGEQQNFYRPEREAQVLRRLQGLNRGPLPDKAVLRLFRELMSACLALEMPLEVAFLGPEGTFTQEAAYKHFGHAIHACSLPAIDEVFRAVESGNAEYGVVPVENSTEGVITHTLDSFLVSSLKIAGEVVLRIHHNLLSRATRLGDVQRIYSHQQSLAQCRRWLDRYLPNLPRIAVSSNAEAARMASEDPGSAAIAGVAAAGLYGLDLLQRNIEDEPDNTTRFLVISRERVPPTGNDKTSLFFATGNFPGALYRALEPFARTRISMTKIESRPSRRSPWDYVFFLDIEGHESEERVAQALAEMQDRVKTMTLLGSYPKAII